MLPSMDTSSFERESKTPLGDMLSVSALPVWLPACDIYEDAATYSIAVALPGCHADQIEVQVQGTMLTIKGEREVESLDGRIWYLQHIGTGPFICTVVFLRAHAIAGLRFL